MTSLLCVLEVHLFVLFALLVDLLTLAHFSIAKVYTDIQWQHFCLHTEHTEETLLLPTIIFSPNSTFQIAADLDLLSYQGYDAGNETGKRLHHLILSGKEPQKNVLIWLIQRMVPEW